MKKLSPKDWDGNPQLSYAVWLNDNRCYLLSSACLILFSSAFDIIVWLDDNILLNICCYHLDDSIFLPDNVSHALKKN
jgi:hypothetical protein